MIHINVDEWELVYEHSINGSHVQGNIDDLIADVENGYDLRIVGDCYGDCIWIYTQPQRIWTRQGKVFVYDQG